MRSKGIVSILAIVLVFSMAIVMFSSVIYAREEGSFCRAQLAACLRGCGADAGCATACHAEFRSCINGLSNARINDRVQLYPSSVLVTIKLNNNTQTKGLVETKKNNTVNNTNKTYPATSFFDVFVEIELSGKSTNNTNTTNSTNTTGNRGHGNPPNNGIGPGTI